MDTTDTNKLTETKPGIVYLSRIPPSMNPLKVKNLLSQFGEVDRLFLQPEGKKDFFCFCFNIRARYWCTSVYYKGYKAFSEFTIF